MGPRRYPKNRISKDQHRIMKERQVLRGELALERGWMCQGCPLAPVGATPPRMFEEMHEVLTRARGGDPTDPTNILLLCRICHAWVTTHETMARELGLVRGRTADEHQRTFRPWENNEVAD